MIPEYNFYYPFLMPFIPSNCDKPPTMYAILNSIVNGAKDEEDYTKIKDLAKYGRTTIFNFDYPLSNKVDKEEFETIILKHYLTRRINFDTVTAFRISLDAKLNEIMPRYNKMFDVLVDWNIFDGEKLERNGTENRTGETSNNTSNTLTNTSQTSNTSDRRYSDSPQNKLTDIQDGNYVTDYNYDTNSGSDSSTSNGNSESTGETTDNNIYHEVITRTANDKINILKEMEENIKSIYTLIFKDLDILFYGLE